MIPLPRQEPSDTAVGVASFELSYKIKLKIISMVEPWSNKQKVLKGAIRLLSIFRQLCCFRSLANFLQNSELTAVFTIFLY